MPPDQPAAPSDRLETETLQAAQQLIEAIALEPVPERLRALAVALGQALERQRRDAAPPDPGPRDPS